MRTSLAGWRLADALRDYGGEKFSSSENRAQVDEEPAASGVVEVADDVDGRRLVRGAPGSIHVAQHQQVDLRPVGNAGGLGGEGRAVGKGPGEQVELVQVRLEGAAGVGEDHQA